MTLLVPPVCRIIADTFEGVSGVPDELRALGVQIEMVTLTAGDYDLGSGVLVERKTVADLHLNLERGRSGSFVRMRDFRISSSKAAIWTTARSRPRR